MSAYATVQAWIKENQGSPFFPPLDESGFTSFAEGRETVLSLLVHPAPPEGREDPLYLYMPLLSLVGARDETLLAFMIELAEANMIGALPSGYRLFYEREDRAVYLGGQFLLAGLDSMSFRGLVEDFVRYGRVEASRLSERLADLVRETTGTAFSAAQPVSAAEPDSAFLNLKAGMLKV